MTPPDHQQRQGWVRPNGGTGFVPPARGTHPGDIMEGIVQVVPVPDQAQLDRWTQQVIAQTYEEVKVTDDGRTLAPPDWRAAQPIRHIVFIVKENRTFDQVFGQRRGVRGDPANTDLGMQMTVRSERLKPSADWRRRQPQSPGAG